ncbi:MAG: hypothetical protein H6Q05_4121, partial [Acidobacteria bacterium]|nr:hypothetical protein [Acidobacteriota bacterium]
MGPLEDNAPEGHTAVQALHSVHAEASMWTVPNGEPSGKGRCASRAP